jgi:hypothetical protein
METTLHRELKTIYAGAEAATEVRLGRYRIDVVAHGRLIEIQHGHLAAIRRKVAALLETHKVTVVKPIVIRKHIVVRKRRGGPIARGRLSPKRGCLLDAFHDLVHFTRVFPHERLRIELIGVEIEEIRFPGHGRRRRWRRGDYQIEDQRLLAIEQRHALVEAVDLRGLLPTQPSAPFHTGELADVLSVARWVAQRIAFCLRECGAAKVIGKSRGALVYQWATPPGRLAA